MEKQGINRLSSLYQPSHRLNHVLPSRDLTRVSGIVCEHDDILGFIVVPRPAYQYIVRGLGQVSFVVHPRFAFQVTIRCPPFDIELRWIYLGGSTPANMHS